MKKNILEQINETEREVKRLFLDYINSEARLNDALTRKATVKKNWKLPHKPHKEAILYAHDTGDGWDFGWEISDKCLRNIDWPFEQQYVISKDWEDLGFEVF